jgi:tetratricopeptide (TPR) repeat protein
MKAVRGKHSLIFVFFIIIGSISISGLVNCYYYEDRATTPYQTSEQSSWMAGIYEFLYFDDCYNAYQPCGEKNTIHALDQSVVNGTAIYWFDEANSLYLNGSYEKAATSYSKAVKLDPYLYQGWLNLGNALYFLGRYQSSLDAYNVVLGYEPDNSNALTGKKQALNALNMTGESKTPSEMLMPNQPQKILNLGSPKYSNGKIGEPVAVGK